MSKVILVPLDGSAEARAAVPVAKTLAGLQGASVRLLHVGDSLLSPPELLDLLGVEADDLPRMILEAMPGDPVEAIAHCVCAGTTIVMSTRGAGATREDVGSVASGILARSLMPLVLVPPERGTQPWALKTMLVPHDGTPSTTNAIGPAAELAQASSANVMVLHVAVSCTAAPAEPGALTTPRYLDQPQHEWPAWAGEFLERLGALYPLQNLRILLGAAPQNPAREVLDHARADGADLLVLVGHGHLGRPEGAQVIRAVLAESPCPVMLLDAEAERHQEEREEMATRRG